jgi:hypothetical protein
LPANDKSVLSTTRFPGLNTAFPLGLSYHGRPGQ